MKLIEVVDEKKVIEKSAFYFPIYKDTKQRLYFSDDGEFMLECLSNSRTYLYKKSTEKD